MRGEGRREGEREGIGCGGRGGVANTSGVSRRSSTPL